MAINNQINFLPGTSITAWQGYPLPNPFAWHCQKAQSKRGKGLENGGEIEGKATGNVTKQKATEGKVFVWRADLQGYPL